jgi:LuxR family transcriptional regulator, quorum-sensing system regulator CciR
MDLRDFERQIEEVPGFEELWPVCSAFFNATGIERTTYIHLPPFGAPDVGVLRTAADGYDAAVVRRYLAAGMHEIETRLEFARNRLEPFYWNEVPERVPRTGRERELATFHALLRQNNGLGVPVFGPNGRNGYCGLEFATGVERLDSDTLAVLRGACQAAHRRVCALVLPTLGPVPSLSGREEQVLGWVARGKSNAAIGDILGISAHTVDAHLRRIFLKLGVGDRITAAVRGIGVGLIHS